MPISLYDTSVTAYLQTLGAASRFMERGLTHCRDNQLDPEQIVETRVYPDMLPFRFQIHSIVHHSVGALEALKSGEFHATGGDKSAQNYMALQQFVQRAQDQLKAMTPQEVNALEAGEVTFQAGEHKLRFKAEDFIQSFSLPNFHFHAATAYGILRSKGVPLGKRDYLGKLRLMR